MTRERAKKLKDLGVKRYNHNLETAESYFSQICKTHDFTDRVNTAKIVKEEGLRIVLRRHNWNGRNSTAKNGV